jgi:hypothetical protein
LFGISVRQKTRKILIGLGDFRLESLQRIHFDVLDQSIEGGASLLVFVSLPGQSHSDFLGWVSNALAPDVLVQLGVDSHILFFRISKGID